MLKTRFILAAALGLAACSDSSRKAPSLVVMTQNVYLGANLDPVMAARADSVPVQAAIAWGQLRLTDFPRRAGALAHQIAASAPHLVGLQEVALFRTQTPSDLVGGGRSPATTVAYDFLSLLLDSLRARGTTYVAAAVDTTIDLEIPAVTGVDGSGRPRFTDVRYTDRDVILVRSGVMFTGAHGARYAAFFPVSVGGMPLAIHRGWSSVTATVNGRSFRFVTTHLEDYSGQIQEAQTSELLAALAGETLPVVLTGDLNSDAEHTTTATYAMVTAAGYRDVWEALRPSELGYTCCQGDLLADQEPVFNQRLDLVLVKGALEPFSVDRIGHDATYKTSSGLWPSDHAGLVAGLNSGR